MPGKNKGEKKGGMYDGWVSGRWRGRPAVSPLALALCGRRKDPPPGERTQDGPMSTHQRSRHAPHTWSGTDRPNPNEEGAGGDSPISAWLAQRFCPLSWASLSSVKPKPHLWNLGSGCQVLGDDGSPMLPIDHGNSQAAFSVHSYAMGVLWFSRTPAVQVSSWMIIHGLGSCILFYFILFYFILLSFWGCTPSIWKFPGEGSNKSHSCWPMPQPQPQQHGIWAMSYTTAHRNSGSLTHGMRPGIKPECSWILVRFITTEPQ